MTSLLSEDAIVPATELVAQLQAAVNHNLSTVRTLESMADASARDLATLRAAAAQNSVVIRSFEAGSNALFLPVGKMDDEGVRVYLAFNLGAPHHYLHPACAKKCKSRGRWPDFVVGRITDTVKCVVPADATPAISSSSKLPVGGQRTRSDTLLSTTPTTPDSGPRHATSQSHGVSPSMQSAVSSPSLTATPPMASVELRGDVARFDLGPPATTHATAASASPDSPALPSNAANPFHLHPGTTYHLLTVEPVL